MSEVTMPPPAASNGHVPEDEQSLAEHTSALTTALEQHAQGLRGLLESQHAVVERFETMLRTAKDEQRRIQRALAAIEGEPATPKTVPKPKASRGGVSERKMSDTLRALEALGAPARIRDIAKEAGIAGETCRKALEQLRAQELVRIAGVQPGPGGPAKLYTLMPGDDRGA
jgi:response regulator of citrate/malate metabolism